MFVFDRTIIKNARRENRSIMRISNSPITLIPLIVVVCAVLYLVANYAYWQNWNVNGYRLASPYSRAYYIVAADNEVVIDLYVRKVGSHDDIIYGLKDVWELRTGSAGVGDYTSPGGYFVFDTRSRTQHMGLTWDEMTSITLNTYGVDPDRLRLRTR